jgi:histone acetyltransferase (RNA polymerase elongator complex component)
MSHHLIIPVFIPHTGCPHRCVFCNQNSISGTAEAPTPDAVHDFLVKSLFSDTRHAVIAFYGGSFTGIEKELQAAYLDAAGEFVRSGRASGIRLSTRPDYIDEESVAFLKEKGVRTVELGVQSMEEEVLRLSGRGHRPWDSARAAMCVNAVGLELGIQIMAGLPGDTKRKFMDTVRGVIALGPDFVRIYPALVVDGAPLAELWKRGEYEPLSLDEAVTQCADAAAQFNRKNIRVVRMGLQPSKDLEAALLAGPYHPSFGHLVESELAYRRMVATLGNLTGSVCFHVNPSELSVYKGIKGENQKKLMALREGLKVEIKADDSIEPGGMRLIVL